MKKLTLMLATFALAACSRDADEPVAEDTAPAGVAAESQPAPASDAPPLAVDAIPADYLGAWDAADGGCEAGSEFSLEVGADELAFYESAGQVTRVEPGEGSVTVALAMTGEGESWESRVRLTLADGGRTLVTETLAPEAAPPVRRTRCDG